MFAADFAILKFLVIWLTNGCCQGHELTLRVLYRLYGEAEEDHDFISSTTAKSVYEMFLLTVVCNVFMFACCIFG